MTSDLGMDSESVEILDLNAAIWHKMPALPHPVAGGKVANLNPGSPHGQGEFALVGGSLEHKEILQFVRRGQFEAGNEATERSLSLPRRDAVVLVVAPRLTCL